MKPSHVSSSGRRFYSEDEIIALQKIVALKFLGFSLEEIKSFMQEEKWDLKESLAFQRRRGMGGKSGEDIFREKRSRLE